ncbi:MAG: DUF3575 domain-containing protein [Ferruginibacter sp.]
MKKTNLLLLFVWIFSAVSAQQVVTVNDRMVGEEKKSKAPGKNIFKINLAAIAFKNYTVQYERKIARKMTLAATFRYMPTGSIPFKNIINQYADNPELETQLNNLQIGNRSFMPEWRFYVGKKGAFRGFYVAPFASIARYETNLLLEYEDRGVTETIPMSGTVNTLCGGLLLGAQWKLSKAVYLDWWIIGPSFGKSDGAISGQKTLSPEDQQAIRDVLDGLDIPLTDFTYDVNNNGASVFFKGPWAGIRAGLCIGIRF